MRWPRPRTRQKSLVPNPEDSGIVGGGRAPEEAALSVEDFTVDWAIVCKSAETLVFEAVQDVAIIQQGLLAGGRSASEPVGIVHVRGQHADPPVVTTIANMGRAVEEEKIKPPFTLVVGDVVALREHLAHSAERPLRGLRIAVTQAEDIEEDLETKLRLEGARPVFMPMLQHSPLTAVEEVLSALRDDLARGDVLIVDSARSARLLADSLERAWMDWRVLSPDALVIGVGSAASRALERRGLRTETIERAILRPEAILALIERDCNGLHVLLAGVEGSLRDVAEELIARGASALEIPLAETQKILANVLALKNALARRQLDAVLFTSPDDVRVCIEAWGADPTRALLEGVLTIAWDPATAAALRNSSITPAITSPRSEADALLPLLAEKMRKAEK
jgi:uroporphyrinogen III methyltransferase/synthase